MDTKFKKGQLAWNKGMVGYRKGYKQTLITRKKISATRKKLGLKPIPYKRNPNIKLECLVCGKSYEVIYSRKTKTKYCSLVCSGIGKSDKSTET